MNSKFISSWSQGEVQQWLIKIKMDKYISNFANNQVNGYYLCYLSNENFNDLKIYNFHDKNILLQSIKLLILEELKINVTYEQKKISVQLNFAPEFTVEMFLNELKDLFNINGNIYLSNFSDNEILISNLKIVELILLQPEKYKNLQIITNNNLQNNNNSSNSFNFNKSLNNNENYNSLAKNYKKDDDDSNKYNIYNPSNNYNINYQNNNINNSEIKTDNHFNNRNIDRKEKDIYSLYKDFKQPMKIEVNENTNLNNTEKNQTNNQRSFTSNEKIYYNNPNSNIDFLTKNILSNRTNFESNNNNNKSNLENFNITNQQRFKKEEKKDFSLRNKKRYSSEKRYFDNNDSQSMSELYNRLQEANQNKKYQKQPLNIPKANFLSKIEKINENS